MKGDPGSTVQPETRRLAAIMFTDMVGFSRQMGTNEAHTLQLLEVHNHIIQQAVAEHHGHIIKTAGDGFLIEFPSVVHAVQCAQAIQAQLRTHNAEKEKAEQIHVRIGIHSGDIVQRDGDVFGDGVNIASRLQTLAEPDSICISQVVYQEVSKKLDLGAVVSLGKPTLKNIAERFQVYALLPESPTGVRRVLQGQRLKLTRWRRTAQVTAVALIVVWAGVVTYRLLVPPPPTSQPEGVAPTSPQPALPLPDKPSIVVLPFVNMSGDPEQEYFGDGITVDLITDLTKLSGLIVTARCSAFTYKGKAVKVQDVGRELGVQYVVGGSVRKVSDRVLITAQLADATTGGQVWAERYERPLQDLLAVQEEVRQEILTHLALKLTGEEQERFERASAPHPEAYDYLRRAQESYFRGTPADNARARHLGERAIEVDPTYARAYSLLASTYFVEWVNQWSPDPQTIERAFALAQQALTLDESWLGAHELVALIYLLRDKHPEQALAVVKRSLAQVPNWFAGYVTLGVLFNAMGRPEETIGLQEQAIRLSPRSDRFLPVLGSAYRSLGRYEEALTALQGALAVNRNRLDAHLELAATYSEIGREEEARAEAAEVLRLSPKFSLEGYKQRLSYTEPAAAERLLAALRKAGLK
jgi:adenylate cyclase